MEGTDAKRFNNGKVPMHLLPFWLLEELAIHYGKGAEKYDPWNWIQGGSTDTCFGALVRHLTKWQAGQDLDEETQTHHMCGVAWNALAILHGYKMGTDRDDRPKLPTEDANAITNATINGVKLQTSFTKGKVR